MPVKHVGDRIRKAMDQAKPRPWSLRRLGDAIGCAGATVQHWIQTGHIKDEWLKRVSEVLGTDPVKLRYGDQPISMDEDLLLRSNEVVFDELEHMKTKVRKLNSKRIGGSLVLAYKIFSSTEDKDLAEQMVRAMVANTFMLDDKINSDPNH